ncbi:MAG: hypothetical protein H7833_12595 [Magnetococcus sp. DMHC-1]|nr:hypothetical protein [Magnetococcales bacterium]
MAHISDGIQGIPGLHHRYFPVFQLFRAGILWGCLILLMGCSSGNNAAEQLQKDMLGVEQGIAQLRKGLGEAAVRNAGILTAYVDIVKTERSDLVPLLTQLGQEATPQSPRITRMEQELASLRATLAKDPTAAWLRPAVNHLRTEVQPEAYDASLVETINIVADLSKGKLSKLPTPVAKADEKETKATPGSALVGNSAYGEWRQDGSGNRVWNWLDAYALFRILDNNRAYRFDEWERSPNRQRSSGSSWGGGDSTSGKTTARKHDDAGESQKSASGSVDKRRASTYGNNQTGQAKASASGQSTESSTTRRASSFGAGSEAKSSPSPAKSTSSGSSSSGSGGGFFSSSHRRSTSSGGIRGGK